MTDKEKAKAYDEALERAKQLYVDGMPQISRNTTEYIFPELKGESEDERIRKAIHIYLDWLDGRNKDYQPKGDYSIKDMIAWLEKQKEYESTDFEYVWDRTDCGALTSALDKYSKEAIINICHDWYDKGIELERKSWLEKQGEQKPTIEMITSEESLGIDSETYNKIVDECIYGEKKSQRMISAEAKEAMYDKPAWSEEDECFMTECINAIATKDGWSFKEKRKTKHWLESLKQRIQS